MKKEYYSSEEYCCLPLDEAGKKKARQANVLFGFGMLILSGIAGMLNPDSSRTAWIVFPYLFLFLPCAYMLFGAHSFWSAPVCMQRAVYQVSIIRMQRSCWGVIILAGLNIVLDAVYIILHWGTLNLIRELCYCGCLILVLLVGIAFGKYFDRTYTPVQITTSL